MPNGSRDNPATQTGFTYIGLLIALAIIGLASTATLQLGSVLQRRNAEAELLEIGADFQQALEHYARATPLGQPTAPKSLQDLLKDPRYPGIHRYLRQVHVDPLTGSTDWGLILTPENQGIVGIFSQSPNQPLKIGNFPAEFLDFENKHSYQDWHFVAPSLATQAAPTLTPSPRRDPGFR